MDPPRGDNRRVIWTHPSRLIEARLLPGVPFAQVPDGVLDKEQAEDFDEGKEADISYLFEQE